jgi:hypothetical protein
LEGNSEGAKKLNGEIQKRIRKGKKNYRRGKCRELEEHSKKERTNELHQQIREICGKPNINTGTLKSRTGKDYIEKDKIIRRWKEYTEDLYKKDSNTSMHFQDQTYTQEPIVMKCEVRKGLREITGNNATGADELPIELIKAAGEAAITVLTALCQQNWENTLWPQEWSRSIFLLLPKKRRHETVFQLQNHCIKPSCK